MIKRPNLVNKRGRESAPDITSIYHPFSLLWRLIKIRIQLQLQSTANTHTTLADLELCRLLQKILLRLLNLWQFAFAVGPRREGTVPTILLPGGKDIKQIPLGNQWLNDS